MHYFPSRLWCLLQMWYCSLNIFSGAVPPAVLGTARMCIAPPFSVTDCSEMQAQAACDVRNARYNKRLQAVVDELGAESPSSSISSTSSLPDRLNQVGGRLHRLSCVSGTSPSLWQDAGV